MSFRDYITDSWYRWSLEWSRRRQTNAKPPKAPSARYLRRQVERLLDDDSYWEARRLLAQCGEAAVPFLAAAAVDPRFLEPAPPTESFPRARHALGPLDNLLELLVAHGAEPLLAFAERHADSPIGRIRGLASVHVLSTGRAECVSHMERYFADPDGSVRTYAHFGIDRAIGAGRATEAFREAAFALALRECDQKWDQYSGSPETVLLLDRARAIEAFSTARWLHAGNPIAHKIVEACNKERLALPAALLRPLLAHALPLAVEANCYPMQYLAGTALLGLARAEGDAIRPKLERALGHSDDTVGESAAQAIALLRGVEDCWDQVLRHELAVGFAALTPPQRDLYCARLFKCEVDNGGLMQFFGNSSGEYVRETIAALEAMGHPEALAALRSAVELFGPRAFEKDRERRLAGIRPRYEELQKAFGPLENALWKSRPTLEQCLWLYAAAHSDDFQPDR